MKNCHLRPKTSITIVAAIVSCSLLILSGCAGAPTLTPSPTPTANAPLVLSSSVFGNGERIPAKYSCQSDNVSPPLNWNVSPPGTQSFALITEDMDGPSGIITHWIIFNIPARTRELKEVVPNQGELTDGALQGNNVRGQVGYTGPCPPAGTTHRYLFTLFALDQPLSLKAGATRTEFLAAIQGHIIALAPLMGTYQR